MNDIEMVKMYYKYYVSVKIIIKTFYNLKLVWFLIGSGSKILKTIKLIYYHLIMLVNF